MMKTILSVAAAGMLVSAGAMAQNASKTEPAQTESNNSAQAADSAQTGAQAGTDQDADQTGKTMSVRQDMKSDLQKAGFSNVHVVPDSFLVQAKDKSGHPVAMIINPHSMMEVVDEGPANQAGNGYDSTTSGNQQTATFTTVQRNEKLSSSIVGLNVYNDQNQDIGTIKDIAYSQGALRAYIVGVGGFLGMGDHYVAVQPAAVQLKWDSNAKRWRATVDATAAQLKSAPEYTYPNEG